MDVNPDPKYGAYALAKIGGKDVAGMGPKQMAEAPTSWSVCVATAEVADTVKEAEAAGGKVIVAPMEGGDQGTMAFIADPSGAAIGESQLKKTTGAQSMVKANTFGCAELNSKKVFGWGEKKSEMAEGMDYTEFLAGGQSIAGGMEMNSMVPAQVLRSRAADSQS